MTRERFLQQLLDYCEWYAQGGHTEKHGIRAFRVLTLTKSEERIESLPRAAAEIERLQGALLFLWFTSEKRFTPNRPSSIVAPIWESPDKPSSRRSVLPFFS